MEIGNNDIVSRRVRGIEEEYRFKLHADLQKYFPDERVFNLLHQKFNELREKDFKGLREESTRFKLLEVNRELQHQNEQQLKVWADQGLDPWHAGKSIFEDGDKDDLDNSYFNKDEVDLSVLEKAADNIDIPADFAEDKNWSAERTRRYLARVAFLVYKSDFLNWPNRVPSSSVTHLIETVANAVHQLYIDGPEVAREYIFNNIKYHYESELLPDVKEQSVQTAEDLSRIAEAKKLHKDELAVRVLSTVRENSEYVRSSLTPILVEQNYDSQSAFWEIHKGEFHSNPMETQMLSSGTEAEVSGYVEGKGGAEFYNKNIGQVRQLDVMSGGFSHVDPKYLPELQARLFKKIDSFSGFKSKEKFDEFIAEIDLIMYSLHLPFDGSGRAIEDFIVFLGEKYGHPLTLTILGYREAGSPILPLKEEVGPKLKRELNALILRRFGIITDDIRDSDAIQKIKTKFGCNTKEAWISWDSEKALVTAELIAGLGDENIKNDFLKNLPSFLELELLWQESTSLEFVSVPEEFKARFDEITSRINRNSTSELRKKVFDELDRIKVSKSKMARRIALMLEAYAISTFGGYEGRNEADILFNLFPNTLSVVARAAQEGSTTTKLKAHLKIVKMGWSSLVSSNK